jgi:S1-C subfamily serine protease
MNVTRVRKGRRAGVLLGGLALLVGAALAAPSQPALGKGKGGAAKGGKPLKREALFAKAAPATVLIYVPLKTGYTIGSGIIVDPTGLLVTNAHVVASAQAQVQVFLFNAAERTLDMSLDAYVRGHKAITGTVIKRGKGIDLALVRLPQRPGGYPAVELGDSDALQVGQDVVAIGNPQGLTWTLTSGAVSALRTDAIQTDASINPGNSGGPLLDMRARLVGVNTFIRQNSQGLGFAIPVNAIKVMIDTFGNNTEPEPPPPPAGLQLARNAVGLASLAINQNVGKMRQINARRSNRLVEVLVTRDLDAVEDLRVRTIKGELTVGQMIPSVVEQMKLLVQHNSAAANESSDPARAELQRQLEKMADHLKLVIQLSQ